MGGIAAAGFEALAFCIEVEQKKIIPGLHHELSLL
jgi:hypothetical protein